MMQSVQLTPNELSNLAGAIHLEFTTGPDIPPVRCVANRGNPEGLLTFA